MIFSRTDKNYLINVVLSIFGFVCIFTGFGYSRQLALVHEVTGYIFTIGIVVHLLMHFRWVRHTTQKIWKEKGKLAVVAGVLAVSIGTSFLLANGNFGHERERGESDYYYRGSQFFGERGDD